MPPEVYEMGLQALLGSGGSGGGSSSGGGTQTTSVRTDNQNAFNPNVIYNSSVDQLSQTGAASFLPSFGASATSTNTVTGSTGIKTSTIIMLGAAAVLASILLAK